jgi:hypothetical protein
MYAAVINTEQLVPRLPTARDDICSNSLQTDVAIYVTKVSSLK